MRHDAGRTGWRFGYRLQQNVGPPQPYGRSPFCVESVGILEVHVCLLSSAHPEFHPVECAQCVTSEALRTSIGGDPLNVLAVFHFWNPFSLFAKGLGERAWWRFSRCTWLGRRPLGARMLQSLTPTKCEKTTACPTLQSAVGWVSVSLSCRSCVDGGPCPCIMAGVFSLVFVLLLLSVLLCSFGGLRAHLCGQCELSRFPARCVSPFFLSFAASRSGIHQHRQVRAFFEAFF